MKNAWNRPLKPVSAPPGLSRRDSNKPGANKASDASKNNKNSAQPDLLRERFLHLTLALVGQNVTLTLTDGAVVEGVLHTFTPFHMPKGKGRNSVKEDHSNKYVIKAATTTHPDAAGQESKEQQPGATLIIPAEKVAQMIVKSIRLEQQNRGGASGGSNHNSTSGDAFVTDTDISSGGATVNDDLVMASSAWVTGDGNEGGGLGGSSNNNNNASNNNNMGRKGLFGTKTATAGDDALRGGIGEWDQFKANEAQFGVKASFDENLYTTSLDKTNVDRRKQMEAERLAREIEGQTSSNMHLAEERGQALEGDYDEEDLYSGVLVTGGEEAKQKERTKLVLKPRSSDAKKEGGDATATAKNESISKAKGGDKAGKDTDGAGAGAPKKMAWAAVVKKAEPSKPASPSKDKSGDEPSTDDSTDKTAEEKESKNSKEKTADDALVKETAKLEVQEKETSQSEDKKDEEKPAEKPKPKSKLNPSAKSFSFNPSAKSFTPSFSAPAPAQAQQTQAPPAEPQHHMGMPMQPHYMQYPQMQPGGMPGPMMYQPAFHPQMRYGQGAAPPQYPGMMPQQQQGQPQQPPPPPAAGMQPGQVPTPPVSGGGTPIPEQKKTEGEDAGTGAPTANTGESEPTATNASPQDAEKSEGDQAQVQQPQSVPGANQQPGQAPPMAGQMGYGPGYYPGGMPMHGGRGPVQHQQPQQHHYPPQMVGGPQQMPVRNYVYGVPPQHMHQHQGNMPQYNQMRGGPGGFSGGPPYMQGGYNHRQMDDDMGYRGGRGGRGGRGRRGGRGGRGNGGRGKYHNNYNNNNNNGQSGNNGNHHPNNQQQNGPSDNPDTSNAPEEKNANE